MLRKTAALARRLDFLKPELLFSIRRIALLTWTIIRLERIVGSAIRTIAIITPLNMVVAVTINRLRCWLGGDRTANDCTSAESSQRIPPAVIVTTIALTIIIIAAMSIPIARTWTVVAVPAGTWAGAMTIPTRTRTRTMTVPTAVAVATVAIITDLMNVITASNLRSRYDRSRRNRCHGTDQKSRSDQANHHFFQRIYHLLLQFNCTHHHKGQMNLC